jgi:hypothetical protein
LGEYLKFKHNAKSFPILPVPELSERQRKSMNCASRVVRRVHPKAQHVLPADTTAVDYKIEITGHGQDGPCQTWYVNDAAFALRGVDTTKVARMIEEVAPGGNGIEFKNDESEEKKNGANGTCPEARFNENTVGFLCYFR